LTDHILNRPAPAVAPKAEAPKPTPAQKAVTDNLRRTKAAEAVGNAISKRRF
jgi:hypothetical protein